MTCAGYACRSEMAATDAQHSDIITETCVLLALQWCYIKPADMAAHVMQALQQSVLGAVRNAWARLLEWACHSKLESASGLPPLRHCP